MGRIGVGRSQGIHPVEGSGSEVLMAAGCRTCVRRRVKCDERHPTCERCEKGHFDCEGYTKAHRFIDEVARTVRHAQKVSKAKPASPEPSRDLIPFASEFQAVSPNMSLAGFEDNTFISFLIANLFAGMPVVAKLWMQTQAEDYASSTAQNSIRALSKVYFGRMHRQQDIIHQGVALYGNALKNLNQDLQNEERAWSLSVLTSAMTLEVYEFVAFSSHAGWLQHAGGVGRLIELRGPWRHQTLRERQFLEWNRATIALACLAKNKRCFLEQPDWRIIPWALEPKSRTLMVDLQGILCSLPGLMEDAAVLQTPNLLAEQYQVLHQTLSNKIEAHLAELYAWRAAWDEANPCACYEVPNPNSSKDQDSLFPTILHFSSLTIANELTMYNAILLLLYRLGFEVIGNTFNRNSTFLLPPLFPVLSPNPLYLPGQAPSPQAIATEICRSADYHLLENQSSAGAFLLLFPLRVAYQAFDDRAQEKVWLEGLMKRVAELSGWEIGRNIGSDAAVGR